MMTIEAAVAAAEAVLAVAGRNADASSTLSDLTPRELDVLRLVILGRTDREIGDALFLSHRTVNSHVSRILAKLGARTRRQAAERGRELGLLPNPGGSTR
jgi:DNA-binding CsgD family transcriptional regulator